LKSAYLDTCARALVNSRSFKQQDNFTLNCLRAENAEVRSSFSELQHNPAGFQLAIKDRAISA
jgi:hypothetical protein